MSSTVAKDDLTMLYDGGPDSEVDIVFVHGLRGHPRTTWEIKDPEDSDGPPIFWPGDKDMLPSTIPKSRIFTFGYPTEFVTFFGVNTESISHTSIDHHSSALIARIGNTRRDSPTSSRPIIFVAHSLGGLVVANSLTGNYDNDQQGKEVVDHTYGAVFLGTPFKGSGKAGWAKIASKTLSMFGDTNDQTITDLDERSVKLRSISEQFHQLLIRRMTAKDTKPIQVACFFEEAKTKKPLFLKLEKDVGHIVTADSATLATCKQMGINATHQGMCRFWSVDNNGYKLVTGKIGEMISNFKKSTEELKEEDSPLVIKTGEITQKDIISIQSFTTASIIATKENAVHQTLNVGSSDPDAMMKLFEMWSKLKKEKDAE